MKENCGSLGLVPFYREQSLFGGLLKLFIYLSALVLEVDVGLVSAGVVGRFKRIYSKVAAFSQDKLKNGLVNLGW